MKLIEQFCVFALRVLGARAEVPQRKAVVGVLGDEARDVRRIDDDGALLFQHRDRVGHHLGLFGIDAAARRRLAGQRHAIDVERARHADARALQSARR